MENTYMEYVLIDSSSLPLAIDHWTTVDVLRVGLGRRGFLRQLLLIKRRITTTAVTRNRWWWLNYRRIDILPPPRRVIPGEGAQRSRDASLPSVCLVPTVTFIIATKAIRRIGSIIVVIGVLRPIRRERSRRRHLWFILTIRCRAAI